ncbi:MAG: hypothetical protein Q9202_007437 [Teloschistes flavicans]
MLSLSLDRQNSTSTGKRKEDAEWMDQAPKRAKNMGRPPILTESQKRKLVRLYLFTNLDMDGIGKLLGFRHKTPKKRTLQNILRETLNDGYHLYRPKDRIARQNRLLQVAFARPNEASDSSWQQNPRFRVITTPTPQGANSGSHVSDASSPHTPEGTAKVSSAQNDLTGLGTSTHNDDPDWINLVHWDEDYIGQKTPSQDAGHERDITEEDDTRMKSAVAMTLPLSIARSTSQIDYTMDDLLEDAQRFVDQRGVDLDGLFKDLLGSERTVEDPLPCVEQGRPSTDNHLGRCEDYASKRRSGQVEEEPSSSPRTRRVHRNALITSYDGINSFIRRLSANIPNTSLGFDFMNARPWTIFFELLHSSGDTWNPTHPAAVTERSSTGKSIEDIARTLITETCYSISAQQPTDDFEALRSMEGMDRFGNTLLHMVAHLGGNYAMLEALITKKTMYRVNSVGQTFMHLVQPQAIDDDMPLLVQMLENLGFPFSQRDCFGQTCIHVLFEKGAYPDYLDSHLHLLNITTYKGRWGFENPIANRHKELEPLREELQRSSCSILHCYCRQKKSWGVNQYDCNGQTELMRACHENEPSLSQHYYDDLLVKGANVHYRDRNAATPLLLAVMSGNIKATRALLRHESNVHARNMDGRGVLRLAELTKRECHDRYANITACEALVIDAGAVRYPTIFDAWSLKDENVF